MQKSADMFMSLPRCPAAMPNPPVACYHHRLPTPSLPCSSLALLPLPPPTLTSFHLPDFPEAPLFDPRRGQLLSNSTSWRSAAPGALKLPVRVESGTHAQLQCLHYLQW